MAFTATQLNAAGFTAAQLKTALFTAGDLKNAGFTATLLKAGGFTASDLFNARFTSKNLYDAGFNTVIAQKTAGYLVTDLKLTGFTAAQLKAAYYTPKELQMGGYNSSDLVVASFSNVEILSTYTTNACLVNGMAYTVIYSALGDTSVFDIFEYYYVTYDRSVYDVNYFITSTISPLQQLYAVRRKGISIADIFSEGARSRTLFTAAQYKEAIFALSSFKGFISLLDLKTYGYNAKELNVAYTLKELYAVFTASELKLAGFLLSELVPIFTLAELKVAFTLRELYAVFTVSELRYAGNIDASTFRLAGFSAIEIKPAGFLIISLLVGLYTATTLKPAFGPLELQGDISLTDLKVALPHQS